MASTDFGFASPVDDRQPCRVDGRQTAELERTVRFGQRRRDLDGILPSGSITVDAAMGVGGLPRGRMIELFGPPAVGKTTLGLQAVSAVQRVGETAAFVDVERAFDAGYAAKMGVDLDALLLARAEDGGQAFRIMEKLAASKAVDLIIVDSAAGLLPPEEREAQVGHTSPFGQCELLASGLRRLSRALQGSPACVLFLNQLRAYQGFGYEETSVGGWSLKLHAAVRADMREKAPLRCGKRVHFRVVKNQLAKPLQMEFDFQDGVGVAPDAELVDRGMESGVIQPALSGLAYGGQVLGRNREEAVQTVATQEAVAVQLETDVRLTLGLPQRKPVAREEQVSSRAVREAANG